MTSSAPAIGRAASLVATAAPPRSSHRHATGRTVQATPSEQCLPVSSNVDGPMGHTVLDTVEDINKTMLLLGSSHGFHFTGRRSTVTPARTAVDEISKFPDGIMHQLVVPPALAGVEVDSVNLSCRTVRAHTDLKSPSYFPAYNSGSWSGHSPNQCEPVSLIGVCLSCTFSMDLRTPS